MLAFTVKIWSLLQESRNKTARAGLLKGKESILSITVKNMAARNRLRYLLLRWTRNETPQLSVKRVLYIASWIEPNGWVIGSAHYLPFVVNVCCCNKRLGPSVVRGTNGFELLYNGRQNTQSHRMHNEAVNEQTHSIAIVNPGFFPHYKIKGKVKGGVRDKLLPVPNFLHVLYSFTRCSGAREFTLF